MMIYELNSVRYDVRVGNDVRSLLTVERLGLKEGTVTGVVGPNGAGKTTLLKIMALLEPPTVGTITYRGERIDARTVPLATRRRMATVFQQCLLLGMSVRDNVALGLKFRRVGKRERLARAEAWLERFRIGHLARRHAHTLSGGEAQRVNLARALVLEPDIVYFDEPFSALDFPTKADIMEDLKQVLRESKATAVFISHDLMEVSYMADHLVVLMDGRIVQEGPPEDVIHHPNEKAEPFLGRWRSMLPRSGSAEGGSPSGRNPSVAAGR